jgi:hypothetical protein
MQLKPIFTQPVPNLEQLLQTGKVIATMKGNQPGRYERDISVKPTFDPIEKNCVPPEHFKCSIKKHDCKYFFNNLLRKR